MKMDHLLLLWTKVLGRKKDKRGTQNKKHLI